MSGAPYLNKCTSSKNITKVVTRHIWEDYTEKEKDIRHIQGSKEIYDLRKQTIEHVFADAKELHGTRYTKYRGLAKVKAQLTLLFACMNLKNWPFEGTGKDMSFTNLFKILLFLVKLS